MTLIEKILVVLASRIAILALVVMVIIGYVFFTDPRPPAPTGLIVGSADCSRIKSCV